MPGHSDSLADAVLRSFILKSSRPTTSQPGASILPDFEPHPAITTRSRHRRLLASRPVSSVLRPAAIPRQAQPE
jgi:hypothetical protein